MRLVSSLILLLKLVPAACVALPMQGCIYAGGRTVREVGPQLSAEAVAFVDPGQTPVEHVIAAFGEPSSRVATRDGTEILRYDSDVRTTEGAYVLMLIASSNNTIERTCWWFEVRDERVMRVWGEKLAPSQLVAPSTAMPLARRDRPDSGGDPAGTLGGDAPLASSNEPLRTDGGN
jgi:hypothetical protein